MRIPMVVAVVLLAAAPKAAKKPARAPAPAPAPVVAESPALVVVERVERPRVDYQAEVYSGVPLDDRYARERGVDKGLVSMVFEKQRRAAFRVPHEKIRVRVRFAVNEPKAPVVIVARLPSAPTTAASARDHVDVIDSTDGLVVVDTTTSNAGIFTTSDVYVFPKGAGHEQRQAMLARIPAVPRERVRKALASFR